MLKLFSRNISGGALYYAIFLMLILNMIGLLLITYFELMYKEDAGFYKRGAMDDDINSAIELLSCMPDILMPGEGKEINLYDDNTSIVKVKVQRWGALRKASFATGWRTQRKQRTVLFGEKEKRRLALVMPERHQYLSLVGKSYINGDCSISDLGLRKGNAEGKYFEGPYLHKGEFLNAEDEIAKPDESFVYYLKNYLDGMFNPDDSIISVTSASTGAFFQPFSERSLIINCGKTISLTTGRYSGNIMIFATDSIVVNNGVALDWTILVSKKIVIKSGFKGRVQAISGSEIVIGQGCNLNYPSFLIAVNDKPDVCVKIGNSTLVNGGILVYSLNPEENKTSLSTGKETNIYGKVYVSGDITLRGNIYGSLYCNRFVNTTTKSFYENFIFDCCIDESKLPEEYSSFCLTGELNKLRTVKTEG